ncbi:MAG: potassium channel protein [candidate division Zixibacteria bacterium]|nr:potassium channel protein [candidate division Zixibacteria bacterium]
MKSQNPHSLQTMNGFSMERTNNITKMLRVLVALALVIVLGTIGFITIEKMKPLDAIYMTVITLSTVGFGEVSPLHPVGRVFAMFLIIFGVALGAFTATTIGQIVLEGQLKLFFGRKKMENKLRKMSGHCIIAGFGRVGRQVASEYTNRKVPFAVIEKEPTTIKRLLSDSYIFVEGEATDEETLRQAGIERARTLISTLPDEAHNVYLALTARHMNKDLKIIARADYEEGEIKLMRAGANHVVSPHVLGGMRMAMASLRPNVVDFMHMTSLGEGGLSIEEIVLPSGCKLAGKSLVESKLKDDYGLTIIGIKKLGGTMTIAPGPQTVLKESDTLVVIGPNEELERLDKHLNS